MKIKITKCIDRFKLIKFIHSQCQCNLSEAQATVTHLDNHPIIIQTSGTNTEYLKSICEFEEIPELTHFDNEEQPNDGLYNVIYTKVIIEAFSKKMDSDQIKLLLDDPNVKSINIKK